MLASRRTLLSVVATAALVSPRLARAENLPRTERAFGKPDAKNTVIECFSLTCSHCAAFAKGPYQEIKKEMIETGKVRWVFQDFPLNQLDLIAFMVARNLPAERFPAFAEALLATQDRWAFARGINPTEELWKMAALAGMSRTTFDKAAADEDLKKWIVGEQKKVQDRWGVDSTPTFIINGAKHTGDMAFDTFRKLIPES